MPPSERPIPTFAAEPPQEPLPYGRWADALAERFLEAARQEADSDIGEIHWFPERSMGGRTYVPAVAPLDGGGEVCGYVSYSREHEGAQATDFLGDAYATEDTAEENPDWTLDLNDEEIGHYRGGQGRRGRLALVWGEALVPNGAVATAELARRLHGRLRRGPPLWCKGRRAGPRTSLRRRVGLSWPEPPR